MKILFPSPLVHKLIAVSAVLLATADVLMAVGLA